MNPTGRGGERTRFGAPTRTGAAQGDDVNWETALERLKAEAVRAVLSRRRSLVARLQVARALQILIREEARARPPREGEDWQAALYDLPGGDQQDDLEQPEEEPRS